MIETEARGLEAGKGVTVEYPVAPELRCVIIGAGLAGLATAAYLARQGSPPLVVEQDHQVGGYAINFHRRGFRFEGSLHSLTGCSPPGATHRILAELGVADDLTFLPLPEFKTYTRFPNTQSFRWVLDPVAFVEEYCRQYPYAADELRGFFRRAFALGALLSDWNNISAIQKLGRSGRHFRHIPLLLRYLTKTAQELLDDFIPYPEVVADLLGFPSFFGTPADQMSAIVFLAAFFERFTLGAYYIRGGSARLVQSLQAQVLEGGGAFAMNQRLVGLRLDVGARRVSGLHLQSTRRGGTLAELSVGGRAVVFCGDPRGLLEFLPRHQGRRRRGIGDEILERETTDSVFEVFLGLDYDVREHGLTSYTHVFDTGDDRIGCIVYSNLDPTCAPPGTSNLVLVRAAKAAPFERLVADLDGGDRGANYRSVKQLFTEEMISKFELVAGLPVHGRALVVEAATPVTYRRYTSNALGAIAGYTTSFEHVLLRRLPYTTQARNLFLASQWVGLGGGYHNTRRTGLEVGRLVARRTHLYRC